MSVATFNQESYLTMETAVQNVCDRYGATVIPMEAFFFDWERLYKMFDATIKQFEHWVPCLKHYITPKTQTVKMPDDCQDIRNVRIHVNGIVKTDQPVLELGRDYSYNKFTNELFAYVTGLYVQYLANYTREHIEIESDPNFIISNVPSTFTLPAIPHPDNFILYAQGSQFTLTPTAYSTEVQEYTSTLGTIKIDCPRLKCTVNLNIPSQDIHFKFKTRYKAIKGIDEGQEFFEASLAEKILTMQGNIKAVCNFSSMPNNITADSLAALGASIHAEVEQMRKDRNKFWLGIQALT